MLSPCVITRAMIRIHIITLEPSSPAPPTEISVYNNKLLLQYNSGGRGFNLGEL